MNILIINAGSSSLKYQLIDMENESVKAKGICERVTVLNYGRVLRSGVTDEVLSDPEVIKAYLGE